MHVYIIIVTPEHISSLGTHGLLHKCIIGTKKKGHPGREFPGTVIDLDLQKEKGSQVEQVKQSQG